MGRREVNIIVDTNILARAVLDDDIRQSAAARKLLAESERVIVPLVALCELVWFMTRSYRLDRHHVARSIACLLKSDAVFCDRLAVEAELSMMEAGGDFADGVIAFEDRQLGGGVFATFDRKAAGLISKSGHESFVVATE